MVLQPFRTLTETFQGGGTELQFIDFLRWWRFRYGFGWSHGDDEIFSREQFLAWFDLDHLGKSAAQFDEAKLRWVNAQHIKAMPDAELAPLVAGQLQKRGIAQTDERLPAICALFKDRCETTVA